MQFQQPQKRTTRKRALGGLPVAESQRATADRVVWAAHADRAVVPRLEIPSLRTGFRRQPHAQRCAHRSALAAQRNGGVCKLARGHRLRKLRYRRLARARSKRRLYSVMRLGREALVRRWSSTQLSKLINQLRHPSPQLLDQLSLPA